MGLNDLRALVDAVQLMAARAEVAMRERGREFIQRDAPHETEGAYA